MVGDFARGHREGVVGRIRHGFSLLEVMVVVVIVGILSTMAVPNLGKLAVHFRGGRPPGPCMQRVRSPADEDSEQAVA